MLETLHPQTAEIIAGHIAIEREMRAIHRRMHPVPAKVPTLKLEHVARLLEASTDNAWTILVLKAVGAFIDVRNSIAHGDPPKAVASKIEHLFSAMEPVAQRPPAAAKMAAIAFGLVSLLHIAFNETPSGKAQYLRILPSDT
ncbi:MAG: hypothetical protein ACYDD1_16985 [Caulobacteraceae bacterium]